MLTQINKHETKKKQQLFMKQSQNSQTVQEVVARMSKMRICAANIFERLHGFLTLVHFRGSQLKFPCEAHNGKHGFTKLLIMFAIVGFTWELELTPTEMDQIQETLKSFKYVRCTYTHFAHPGHHCYFAKS
jgi:hypothetical protein